MSLVHALIPGGEWPGTSHTISIACKPEAQIGTASGQDHPLVVAMQSRTKLRVLVMLLCSALACGKERTVSARFWLQGAAAGTGQLDVIVMDQNGQPLPLVIVILQPGNTQQSDKIIARERTTPSGNATLRQLLPGTYRLLVEKQGFYTTTIAKVEIMPGQTVPVEVRLQPVREYREEIEVTAQPSPIDPEQTASSQSITTADISAVPYHTV